LARTLSPMQTYLAPLIALIGLILYLAANSPPPNQAGAPLLGPKASRIGEIMFFCGLLATLMRLDGSAFRLH